MNAHQSRQKNFVCCGAIVGLTVGVYEIAETRSRGHEVEVFRLGSFVPLGVILAMVGSWIAHNVHSRWSAEHDETSLISKRCHVSETRDAKLGSY